MLPGEGHPMGAQTEARAGAVGGLEASGLLSLLPSEASLWNQLVLGPGAAGDSTVFFI